jgi:hypothetical protein
MISEETTIPSDLEVTSWTLEESTPSKHKFMRLDTAKTSATATPQPTIPQPAAPQPTASQPTVPQPPAGAIHNGSISGGAVVYGGIQKFDGCKVSFG